MTCSGWGNNNDDDSHGNGLHALGFYSTVLGGLRDMSSKSSILIPRSPHTRFDLFSSLGCA